MYSYMYVCKRVCTVFILYNMAQKSWFRREIEDLLLYEKSQVRGYRHLFISLIS
jgi:hypothetical protein